MIPDNAAGFPGLLAHPILRRHQPLRGGPVLTGFGFGSGAGAFGSGETSTAGVCSGAASAAGSCRRSAEAAAIPAGSLSTGAGTGCASAGGGAGSSTAGSAGTAASRAAWACGIQAEPRVPARLLPVFGLSGQAPSSSESRDRNRLWVALRDRDVAGRLRAAFLAMTPPSSSAPAPAAAELALRLAFSAIRKRWRILSHGLGHELSDKLGDFAFLFFVVLFAYRLSPRQRLRFLWAGPARTVDRRVRDGVCACGGKDACRRPRAASSSSSAAGERGGFHVHRFLLH